MKLFQNWEDEVSAFIFAMLPVIFTFLAKKKNRKAGT